MKCRRDRSLWNRLALVYAGLALLASAETARAQAPSGRGGLILLVFHPAVQKELGLDESGMQKVVVLAREFQREMQEEAEKNGLGPAEAQKLAQLGPEERAARLNEMKNKMMAVGRKMDEKFLPKLKDLLTAEQFLRVRQIRWQVGGSLALDDSEVATALQLDKKQQEKVAAVNREYGEKQDALFSSGFSGGNPQEIMAKAEALNGQRDAKAFEILTKEQQARFSELKGKAFDLSQLQVPGPPN